MDSNGMLMVGRPRPIWGSTASSSSRTEEVYYGNLINV